MEKITASTACALLIGNELLNGSVDDCNLGELARSLHGLGIRLKRALVLPDEVELLTAEIQNASRTYDVVFTSGGIGPTHDDVTIAAVAKAFGVDIVVDEELRAATIEYYGAPLSEAHVRLAEVPPGFMHGSCAGGTLAHDCDAKCVGTSRGACDFSGEARGGQTLAERDGPFSLVCRPMPFE